jgi:hypothetical protein
LISFFQKVAGKIEENWRKSGFGSSLTINYREVGVITPKWVASFQKVFQNGIGNSKMKHNKQQVKSKK